MAAKLATKRPGAATAQQTVKGPLAAKKRKAVVVPGKKLAIAKAGVAKAAAVKMVVAQKPGKTADEAEAKAPCAKPAGTGMDIGRFYAFLQCSLRMEALELMKKDFELQDPEANKMWPAFQRMAKRNLGSNEKWVPFHTVLGVHEVFLVREVHHAKVACWTKYHRFVSMFIFRSHCKRDLFTEVQMPFLKNPAFWKDPVAGFKPGSAMEKAVAKFRAQGRALQTACFLIIPERLIQDDDQNLILNFMIRTQRLIQLAAELWPLVQNKRKSADELFDEIKEKILAVKGLGDTWVKMLMVVIDIACPHLGLLQDRCEVGVGAADPMRKILEEEGLISPKEKRDMAPKRPQSEEAQSYLSLKAGIVCIKKNNIQMIQVTKGLAGSLDRAHAICDRLLRLAKAGADKEALHAKREQLFADKSLKVPKLGLDAQAEELLQAIAEKGPVVHSNEPSPSQALAQLRSRINSSTVASSRHFWELITKVEAYGRKHFANLPLVLEQMKTQKAHLSCVTLQVQLCEFRQFENFTTRSVLKRPAGAMAEDED
eukprot:CAMPEP_0197907424 /NCGR_PEP_ID=MMETSP1439-20131203/64808_1 /TAXON_ID=66791 /ORGANISM="Gonyaulax spinifera, Strain CCMP409" /LENGTH=540 /DNA_ID=CAMNT_0043528855 /DNA_START=57 /DNA_END=1679 /DNA_ORIENTATION=+